jgi:predicted esterase
MVVSVVGKNRGLALALLLVACRVPAPEQHGVRIVRVPGNPRAPLVVALHGRGGTPEHFLGPWRGDFEVAGPQGFLPVGNGYGWFDWPAGLTQEELASRIIAAVDRLWPAIAEIAAGRKVIVLGFSQGAVLAFALAARHPEAVAWAFPIAGTAPPQVLLADRAPAPVYAVHGADDSVIDLSRARATVDAFKAHGGTIELRVFPGVDHAIPDPVRDDVLAHLRAAAR